MRKVAARSCVQTRCDEASHSNKERKKAVSARGKFLRRSHFSTNRVPDSITHARIPLTNCRSPEPSSIVHRPSSIRPHRRHEKTQQRDISSCTERPTRTYCSTFRQSRVVHLGDRNDNLPQTSHVDALLIKSLAPANLTRIWIQTTANDSSDYFIG